jgi:hypothetical protein
MMTTIGQGTEVTVYLEGPSTANQRIEYFWNFLRRECTDFWICFFRDVEADGHFDGSFLDINLLQYCFMHLVQVCGTRIQWPAILGYYFTPTITPNHPSIKICIPLRRFTIYPNGSK